MTRIVRKVGGQVVETVNVSSDGTYNVGGQKVTIKTKSVGTKGVPSSRRPAQQETVQETKVKKKTIDPRKEFEKETIKEKGRVPSAGEWKEFNAQQEQEHKDYVAQAEAAEKEFEKSIIQKKGRVPSAGEWKAFRKETGITGYEAHPERAPVYLKRAWVQGEDPEVIRRRIIARKESKFSDYSTYEKIAGYDPNRLSSEKRLTKAQISKEKKVLAGSRSELERMIREGEQITATDLELLKYRVQRAKYEDYLTGLERSQRQIKTSPTGTEFRIGNQWYSKSEAQKTVGTDLEAARSEFENYDTKYRDYLKDFISYQNRPESYKQYEKEVEKYQKTSEMLDKKFSTAHLKKGRWDFSDLGKLASGYFKIGGRSLLAAKSVPYKLDKVKLEFQKNLENISSTQERVAKSQNLVFKKTVWPIIKTLRGGEIITQPDGSELYRGYPPMIFPVKIPKVSTKHLGTVKTTVVQSADDFIAGQSKGTLAAKAGTKQYIVDYTTKFDISKYPSTLKVKGVSGTYQLVEGHTAMGAGSATITKVRSPFYMKTLGKIPKFKPKGKVLHYDIGSFSFKSKAVPTKTYSLGLTKGITHKTKHLIASADDALYQMELSAARGVPENIMWQRTKSLGRVAGKGTTGASKGVYTQTTDYFKLLGDAGRRVSRSSSGSKVVRATPKLYSAQDVAATQKAVESFLKSSVPKISKSATATLAAARSSPMQLYYKSGVSVQGKVAKKSQSKIPEQKIISPVKPKSKAKPEIYLLQPSKSKAKTTLASKSMIALEKKAKQEQRNIQRQIKAASQAMQFPKVIQRPKQDQIISNRMAQLARSSQKFSLDAMQRQKVLFPSPPTLKQIYPSSSALPPMTGAWFKDRPRSRKKRRRYDDWFYRELQYPILTGKELARGGLI